MVQHDGNGWVICRCGSRHWGRHGAAGLLLTRWPTAGTDAARDRRIDPALSVVPVDPGDPAPSLDPVGPAGREVLLQLRAAWTHQGGTWGLPGGARDSHEDAVAAALREASEEAGIRPEAVEVVSCETGVDHGDWSFTYVLAVAVSPIEVAAVTPESDALRWVRPDDVAGLPLHPAFDDAWPGLRARVLSLLRPVRGGA